MSGSARLTVAVLPQALDDQDASLSHDEFYRSFMTDSNKLIFLVFAPHFSLIFLAPIFPVVSVSSFFTYHLLAS